MNPHDPFLPAEVRALLQTWADRDARYRATKRDGVTLRFPLPEPRAVEAIRLWRIDEAEALAARLGHGSPDELVEVARAWRP